MNLSEFIIFIFIGVGLSLDSFAVSISVGLMKREIRFLQAAVIASSLAFFQAFFPLMGWIIGNSLQDLISSVDHWIAFGLLTFIGARMIIEGSKPGSQFHNFDPYKISVVIGLSIATSIDALVVGLSFGLLEMPILFPIIVIGVVTFIASMLGMLFGKNIPAKRSRQSLMLGGLILSGIGIKILAEHMFF